MRPERDGFINFLKPTGMTSHDVVLFMRRLSGIKRIGHLGTLDPMAAGVLPLCLGKAGRLAEYLGADGKAYRCEMRLGLRTDTQDVWGRTLFQAEEARFQALDEAAVMDAARAFVGEQSQIPPAYSAVKVKGKKLYEYARAGEKAEAPPRTIFIRDITVNSIDLERGLVRFDVVCSKGTYIRTLCADIGEKLGCGAAMSGLVRTASGCFSIEESFTAEVLEAAFRGDSADEPFIPPDAPLRRFAALRLTEAGALSFVNGAPVDARGFAEVEEKAPMASDFAAAAAGYEDRRRVYGADGAGGAPYAGFLGVGKLEEGVLRADKVLYGAI
jgi:tRNA pseudouridine55 synthase